MDEKWVLIEWINGNPILDGSNFFDSKSECLKHWNELNELKKGLNLGQISVHYTMISVVRKGEGLNDFAKGAEFVASCFSKLMSGEIWVSPELQTIRIPEPPKSAALTSEQMDLEFALHDIPGVTQSRVAVFTRTPNGWRFDRIE